MGRRSGGAAIARDVESNRFGPVEKGSDAMSGFQNLSGTLANDDAWRHRVAGCDARHNGTVSDTKIIGPMDLERAVQPMAGLMRAPLIRSGPVHIHQSGPTQNCPCIA